MTTTTTTPPPDTTGKLLDYNQLAVWLNDSVRHLRRLVHENRIPYLKVGHFIRFDADQISRWLEDNRHGR